LFVFVRFVKNEERGISAYLSVILTTASISKIFLFFVVMEVIVLSLSVVAQYRLVLMLPCVRINGSHAQK